MLNKSESVAGQNFYESTCHCSLIELPNLLDSLFPWSKSEHNSCFGTDSLAVLMPNSIHIPSFLAPRFTPHASGHDAPTTTKLNHSNLK